MKYKLVGPISKNIGIVEIVRKSSWKWRKKMTLICSFSA